MVSKINGRYASEFLQEALSDDNIDETLDNYKKVAIERAKRIMTPKDYDAFLDNANKSSKEEWKNLFVASVMSITGGDGKITNATLKDVMRAENNLEEKVHSFAKDTVFMKEVAPWAEADINKRVIAKIRKSSPSDIICVDMKGDFYLQDLFGASEHFVPPADIFFAKTIPLMDCVISVDETSEKDGRICTCRVVIFDDYSELIDKAEAENDEDTAIVVGALLPADNPYVALPIAVVRGVDGICGCGIVKAKCVKQKEPNITNEQLSQIVSSYYRTWYGIQISLLHPEIKNVYKKYTYSGYKDNDNKAESIQGIRRTMYIKKHYITADEMDNALQSNRPEEGHRKYGRQCLVWYVIGHWRTLQSGKKVFVSPHWRGKLREIKQNLDNNERIRDINFFQQGPTPASIN